MLENGTDRFNPAFYSDAENEFLLAHLGEPPIVALRSIKAGVNPKAVEPLLRRVVELEQEKQYGHGEWVGLDALRAAIEVFLTQARKWAGERRRGAPRFPSMHTYTAKGRAILGGPGADAGFVQTYLDRDGARKSFIVDLQAEPTPEWVPEWAQADEPQVASGLSVNHELSRMECFCGHTEKFREESRSSYGAARGRMSRHLRSATEDVDRHREVYAREYNQ